MGYELGQSLLYVKLSTHQCYWLDETNGIVQLSSFALSNYGLLKQIQRHMGLQGLIVKDTIDVVNLQTRLKCKIFKFYLHRTSIGVCQDIQYAGRMLQSSNIQHSFNLRAYLESTGLLTYMYCHTNNGSNVQSNTSS